MRISTEIGSAARLIGEEKTVELVAKAGFDAYDFSMMTMAKYHWDTCSVVQTNHPLSGKNYLQFVRNIRHIAEDNGIECNQSHAPFPVFSKDIWGYLERAIECTAEAGGKICVIHPANTKSPAENAEMYHVLLPVAKSYGIRIATENMWGWDSVADHAIPNACSTAQNFKEHLEVVNDPSLVACLDIGHGEMKGLGTSAVELIHTLGDHLQALHIHDNDRWHDSHALPFTMDIDFDPIVKALKDINYKGDFTLEADRHLVSADTVAQGIQEMAQAARRLADMFDRA